MSHGHYQILCKECDTVIEQCRCPAWGSGKATTYEICEKCKELKEEKDEG